MAGQEEYLILKKTVQDGMVVEPIREPMQSLAQNNDAGGLLLQAEGD